MTISKRNLKKLLITTLFLFMLTCSYQAPVNDFFGIMMAPEETKYFKIQSYSEKDGISYLSNAKMNPKINAWAEMNINSILIKVVNNSDKSIAYSYGSDEFTFVTTKNKKHVLIKGDALKYPSKNQITPDETTEFYLQLPSDFWSTIGMRDPQSHNTDYMEKFWTGENRLLFLKENIKILTAKLGGETTLVLKPVPGAAGKE